MVGATVGDWAGAGVAACGAGWLLFVAGEDWEADGVAAGSVGMRDVVGAACVCGAGATGCTEGAAGCVAEGAEAGGWAGAADCGAAGWVASGAGACANTALAASRPAASSIEPDRSRFPVGWRVENAGFRTTGMANDTPDCSAVSTALCASGLDRRKRDIAALLPGQR